MINEGRSAAGGWPASACAARLRCSSLAISVRYAVSPGSRVRVRLTIGKPYKATLVPDTAILADQDKRYVLVVDDKKMVKRKNVTLGAITDDGMRAIQPADKRAEGDNIADWQVIVDNLQRARLNYPVEIASPNTAVAQR